MPTEMLTLQQAAKLNVGGANVFNAGFPSFPMPLWLCAPTPFFPPHLLCPPPVSDLSPTSPKQKLFRPWDDDKPEPSGPSPDLAQLQQQLNQLTSKAGDETERQATLELIATNMGKTQGGHRCIYCSKVYSRKYGLKIHLRTHTGFKPLSCKVCKRAFGDPSNLNKHTRLHAENATAFKCHLCGKLLVRKRDLERHLSSRHGNCEESVSVDIETV